MPVFEFDKTRQAPPVYYRPEILDSEVAAHFRNGVRPRVIREMLREAGHPAVVTDIAKALKRMGLVYPAGEKVERPTPSLPCKVNPMAFARLRLDGRLVEKPLVNCLDGLPSRLDTIMRAANEAAFALGLEQCLHKPRWEYVPEPEP